MARIVMVSEGSPILDHPSTKIVAEYPSGEILVRTEAPGVEAGEDDRTHGLTLPGIDAATIAEVQAFPLPETDEEILAYVEFAGPTLGEWLDILREGGVTPLRFQPVSSYLCRGKGSAFEDISEKPFVLSITRLVAGLKPALAIPEAGGADVWVVLEGSADINHERARLEALQGFELQGDVDRTSAYLRIPGTMNSDAREDVLGNPFVVAIEPREPVLVEDEVADLILVGQYDNRGHPNGEYLRWLEDQGINGRDVTIGIVDNGVDESHDAYSDRITSKDSGRQWHGTFVAGHAAGRYLTERDSDGFIYGLGMAPAAELISQSNQKPAAEACRETVTTAGPDGATGTVQNNSWGVGKQDPMNYESREASYDELARNADPGGSTPRPLTICFSAGNKGSEGLTRPKSAKNVIVTGNSENYRPSVGNSQSDDIDDVYSGPHGSSYGNCGDGRVRPHVMAPGEWTASANFDSHPGHAEYISPKLTWGGGTSGASPKTAGACALLTEWWRNHNANTDPSPAMLRALVVNGAEDMNFDGPIPNRRQGWGRMNLANVVSSDVHHTYVDQSVLLQDRGEERQWRIRVSDNSMPLRITLAWTDPPGAVGTGTSTVPAVVNFLGLRVETNGQTYYGNNFSNGWSVSGELPDPGKEGWDNLQNVYLQAGTAGSTVTIRVRGLNITTNCLTGSATDPRQDFALVITNGFLDTGSSPTDMFTVVDDTSAGSGSSVDDHWDSGSSDDDEDDADWWGDTSGDGADRPTLRRGDRGDDVRELQRLLNQLDYLSNAPDGIFGSGTQRAVREFQTDQGLTGDGVVGRRTWEALYEAAGDSSSGSGTGTTGTGTTTSGNGSSTSPPFENRATLRRGDRGDDVRELQRLLNDVGFLDGSPDGIFGAGTRAAVREFQRDEGLSADGVVGQRTWEALYTAAGEWSAGEGSDTSDSAEPASDDWWDNDSWSDDDDNWWEETSPASETARDEDKAAEALRSVTGTAHALMGNSGGRLLLAGDARTESGGDAGIAIHEQEETTRENLAAASEASSRITLREALRQLMQRWDEFGAHEDDGVARRRAAVIVVGARTRVSSDDLRALRRLAFHGDLYLVSSYGPVLQFLSQRLHMTRGIHYRQAPEGDLAKTLRAVSAEATGAQGLILRADETGDNGSRAFRWGFHLTELDRRAVIEIAASADSNVMVKPPGANPFRLTTRSRRAGVRLTEVEGTLQVALESVDRHPWEGFWEVRVRGPEDQPQAHGSVWSGLGVQVSDASAESAAPATESGGQSGGGTFTVSGDEGVSLRRMRVRESAIGANDGSESPRRPVEVKVPVSRLDREAMPDTESGNGADHDATSQQLDGHLQTSPKEGQANIVALETEVSGASPAGLRFDRQICDNIIRLVPRHQWRLARRQSTRTMFIPATVSEIRYAADGQITGLTLQHGDGRERPVRVVNPMLRSLLKEVEMEGSGFHFAIRDDAVEEVLRILPPSVLH